MTNLTEKIEKTFFYIKLPNGEVIQGDEFALGLYRMCNDGDKVEVLEKVPSYEQWEKHRKTLLKTQEKNCDLEIINAKLKTEYEKECHRADELEDSYWKAEKENAKLKELLKDTRDSIVKSQLKITPEGFKLITEIVAKIDEVLK